MAALALEVNDVALVALREGASAALPESPGVALLDGSRLLVGTDAAEQARLKPRFVHDSYWERLDTVPAGPPFPDDLRRADLAHAQLAALRADAGPEIDEAFLAVPGFWTVDALGLLLSVARAAEIPVVGLVDAAVAAASLGHQGETLLHLDLTRHRACLTVLSQGAEVARTNVVSVEGRGWATLEDAWADVVAGQFVRETRFDPRHAGASEQALHDALPGWLGELCLRQTLRVALQAGGREHAIELTRASLLEAAAEHYRWLAGQAGALVPEGAAATVLLAHRVARLPGLADRLREIRGTTVVELHSSAAARGALLGRERLRRKGAALPFVTRLPSGLLAKERPPAAAPPADRPDPSGARVTHVVAEGIAHRIGAEGLAVGTSPPPDRRGLALRGEAAGVSRHHITLHAADGGVVVEDHSSLGTFLNEERVSGKAMVRPGDRLRLGQPGLELLLTAVEE